MEQEMGRGLYDQWVLGRFGRHHLPLLLVSPGRDLAGRRGGVGVVVAGVELLEWLRIDDQSVPFPFTAFAESGGRFRWDFLLAANMGLPVQ